MDLEKRINRFSYKLFGNKFSDKRDEYSELAKNLDQARMDIDYDLYLAKYYTLSIIMGVVGILTGLFITALLVLTGIIFVSLPISFPQAVADIINQYRVGLVAIVISLLLGLIFFVTTLLITYYMPKYKASERKREINKKLPSAVTYMYALSKGGMNIIQVFESIAEADDVYSEASNEFDVVINNMRFFGMDLEEALLEMRATTPSEDLQEFIDDLLGIIDSGGNLQGFLEIKSEEFYQVRERSQRDFLDKLALLSEAYVTVFVATPLFVVVIMTVLTLVSGSNLLKMYMVVYGMLPLATLGYVVLIGIIAEGLRQEEVELKIDRDEITEEEIEEKYEEEEKSIYKDLLKGHRRYKLRKFLESPLEHIREKPYLTFVATGPLVLIYYVMVFVLQLANPSLTGMIEQTWNTTFFFFTLPFLILAIPYTIFYERQTSRIKSLNNKLPEALKKLATSNEAGMSITDGLKNVAETSDGPLPQEFGHVYNISNWNTDISDAMKESANRMNIPRYSKAVKLITKAQTASGDLKDVLSIAARDAKSEKQFDKDRNQEMFIYVGIIIVSFFVFIGVLAIMEGFFLAQMESLSGSSEFSSRGGAGGFNPSELPLQKFDMLFLHAAVLQGFLSGLTAGKMVGGSVKSGLKYSIFMVIVATIAFALI